MNLLSNYKNTLDVALENADVLKLVAHKTSSGSLIRVSLKHMSKGVEVFVRVIGENGKDILFNQKTQLVDLSPQWMCEQFT